uniref:Intraflagellar transport protein 57 homolog n=1 Tax=Phallusia mammillata TaxID=59560 RepID=A0A6F9DEH5_9ASCI|nr:intraflagellar transport protein 57 homolog [Phallusia mammillata]
MADDGRRGGGEEEDRGPAAMYQMFEVMSELMDKLKLLNYEEHFLKKYNIKPFSRHYFAIATNPGEQFYIFTALSAWLINVAGRPFEMPQEFDDPNATVSGILEDLRRFGVNTDFPPSKLKSGSGEFACFVLDRLADAALLTNQFSWNRPVYPYEEQDEEENIIDEDETELKLERLEEEIGDYDANNASDDDEGAEPFLDLGSKSASSMTAGDASKPIDIMVSSTNADEWKLEVERVAPSLKVTIRTDNKDWRTHVDQMHQHKKGIESSLVDAKTHLDKLHSEIRRTLEKISSREKYINSQLEHHVQEYRGAQDQLAQAKEKYKQGSGGVTEHSRTLAELTEELDKVKMEMEERGSSMTDGAPLVKIKQTLNRLKTESIQMDIRIGVIEHVLMQARLRDKSLMHKDMNKQHGTSLSNHLSTLSEGDNDTAKNYFANI